MVQSMSFKYAKIVAGLLLFYLGIKYALPVVAPFIVGLSVAALVRKPARLLASRIPKLSEKLCRIIMACGLIFAASAVVYLLLCSFINGAVSFCPGIPERLEKLRQFAADASTGSGREDTWGKFTAFIASGANRCIDFFSENYRQYLPSVLSRSTRVVSGLPSLLTGTVFAVLSALFASSDPEGIKFEVKSLLPAEAAGTVSLVISTSVSTVSALIKTYGTIMLVTFGELCIGLGIMSLTGHGTGRVITTALIISLVDLLPVLGTGTVLIPWGIFEMLSGRMTSGIMLLMIFAITETVRNLLEPKLISGKLELHPFFTLLGVYAGGKLFGAAGVFVMPPALMIIRRLIRKKADETE